MRPHACCAYLKLCHWWKAGISDGTHYAGFVGLAGQHIEHHAREEFTQCRLTGRLAPDHKTIADFRRENGPAIQAACAQFVVLCRQLGLFGAALVAIDGSKFKAVNTRDKNFTAYKVKRRIE